MSDGVWGYSSPNCEHVLFCTDTNEGFADLTLYFRVASVKCEVGMGVYRNRMSEPTLAISREDFNTHADNIQPHIQNQESVLVLGSLRAMNWRDAWLVYDFKSGITDLALELGDNIGTWLEGTPKLHEDYSVFHNHYFVVRNNPAPDRATQQEREDAQIVLDLRNALSEALGPRMSREQGQLMHSATVWLQGKTLTDGTTFVG